MVSLLKKITAPNGGVFTGKGTNTYLIGKDEITVVDPGPNIPEHIENIINQIFIWQPENVKYQNIINLIFVWQPANVKY